MNSLVILIFVLFLPGILAVLTYDLFTVKRCKWGQFEYVIYAYIYGIFSYLILQALYVIPYTWPIQFEPLSIWGLINSSLEDKNNSKLNLVEVFKASVIGFALSLIFIKAKTDNWVHKTMQRLSISYKYGDANLFSFFLNLSDYDWYRVRDFEKKLTYVGRAYSFSENEDGKIQELVLKEVTVYSTIQIEGNKTGELYSVDAIYLSKSFGQFEIEGVKNATQQPSDH